jgi:cell division septation protein DedD
MITEPRNEARPTARASSHAKRPPSSLAGLKPFLLAGILVVMGLLIGLNFLLGGSGESSPMNAEPTPGAIAIGPPPGGSLSSDVSPGEETPLTATTPGPSTSPTDAHPSDQAPVTPSEFTFYETLKKAPHDPAATVGLTPKKSATKQAKPKPAVALSKPAPAKHHVIDTTTADNSTFHYTVQVASFRQQSMAEKMIKALNKKGHKAYMTTGASSDGVTYRVRVGRFTTRKEADHAAKQLAAKEQLHPFIATVEPELSEKS